MAGENLIELSLNEAAVRHGDPTAAVYERLFSRSPEMRALFINDVTGAAKGEMLAVVFETLLDFAGAGAYAPNMIRAEIVNHENLGVPPAVFATFFSTVMETIRELAGEAWSPATQEAWDALLSQIDRVIGESVTA